MHWRNSSFQVAYFLVGKCHTADEAYRVLHELREERQMALDNAKASSLRTQARQMRAQRIIDDAEDVVAVLEAQADLLEIDAFAKNSQDCIDEAQRELSFIDVMLERINPHRKFKHLPDHEAHQACQQEEWKYELAWRAENFLASGGHIPSDHLATMRMHPEFEQVIYPHIERVMIGLREQKAPERLLQRPMEAIMLDNMSDIPKLLEK